MFPHCGVVFIWIVAKRNLGGRGSRNAISVHIKQIYAHLFLHEKNHILDKMGPSIPIKDSLKTGHFFSARKLEI